MNDSSDPVLNAQADEPAGDPAGEADSAELGRQLRLIDTTYAPLLGQWGFEQITREFPEIIFRNQAGCTVSFAYERERPGRPLTRAALWVYWGDGSVRNDIGRIADYFAQAHNMSVPNLTRLDRHETDVRRLELFAPELFSSEAISYEIAAHSQWLRDRLAIREDQDYDLSPDGNELLVSNGGPLQILDLRAGALRPVAGAPPIAANPMWGPTGDQIAFRGSDRTIYVMAKDGSSLRATGSTGFAPDWGPRRSYGLSPNGTEMAITHGRHLRILDLLAGSIREISGSPPLLTNPVWSPTGDQIAFRNVDHSMYILSRDGSSVRSTGTAELAHGWGPRPPAGAGQPLLATPIHTGLATPATAQRPLGMNPLWSPTGDQIAFMDTRRHVNIMSSDGSALRNTRQAEFSHEWGEHQSSAE